MKVLFLGDVMGKPGRYAVKEFLQTNKNIADIIIVNGENATHGKGLSIKHAQELFNLGVDVITSGNHIWDHDQAPQLLRSNPCVLRPINFDSKAAGQGFYLIERSTFSCLVVNVQGRLFMPQLIADPFTAMDQVLTRYGLKRNTDAIIVDFHAETTAEKQAMGFYLDGRVSAVLGTHTHVPTADERILSKGTAYQTDSGMCGNYDSIIGNEKMSALKRFTSVHEKSAITPAEGKGEVRGVLIDISDQTGLAKSVKRIKSHIAQTH